MKELKQVIVVRKDLNMSPGKLAAQVAHASVSAFLQTFVNDKTEHEVRMSKEQAAYRDWASRSQVKIILAVNSKQELVDIYDKAQHWDLPRSIIIDEGRTELTGMNYTAVAIGPDDPREIDLITGDLPLL